MVDFFSTLLVGALGGGVALAMNRVFTTALRHEALVAEARGTVLIVESILEQVRDSVVAAQALQELVLADKPVAFEDVNALWSGWVISAPKLDLIEYAERVRADEAFAITQYLDRWYQVVQHERRYVDALDALLEALDCKPPYSIRAHELASRTFDEAAALLRAIVLLGKQAAAFKERHFKSLSDEEAQRAIAQAGIET